MKGVISGAPPPASSAICMRGCSPDVASSRRVGRPFHRPVSVLHHLSRLARALSARGRALDAQPGRDFEADALRRDFTVNALSLGRDGILYDYAGGLDDLAARRVRFIGDPRQRIREDYLRILRFFRFSARYGQGPLDREGFRAAIEEREGVALLSRERVRAELLKLLAAPRASEVVTAVCEAGLLSPLLA